MNNKNLIDISGLWIKEGKKGTQYLSGKLNKEAVFKVLQESNSNDIYISVFKKMGKKNENSPDYSVTLQIYEKKKPNYKTAPTQPSFSNDEIPF